MTEIKIEKRKMCIERPIRVMSYDTDYMQIVHNVVYVRWFEDLRTAILDEYFPLEEMMQENNTPILSETRVKYKRPLTLEDKPLGTAWVEEMSSSRWKVRIEITVNGKIHCEGSQIGYYFSMDKQRPVRFPESLIQAWENM